MDGLIPWARLEARIAPTCPKGGGKGRQPHPLSAMLRVHCVQLFCNLKRPGDGGPACEAESVRRFAGAVLEKVPDGTTIPTSATGWSAADLLFQEIRDHLADGGIVDATIISALSSAKNGSNARDPEMHKDEEGEPAAFRDEAAHRHRPPESGAPSGGNGIEHFNEAGANCPGKLRELQTPSPTSGCFNEAGANCPGKRLAFQSR